MNAARKQKPEVDGWLSVHAAALALGTTRYRVARRAMHGELVTKLDAGRTVVSRASVDAALASQGETPPDAA